MQHAGQDASQKNLSKWSAEDWQTKEGSGNAKQADGTEKRYLPKAAWEQMSEEEKQATEDKKLEGSKEGKQFVGNTDVAKGARRDANVEDGGEGAEEEKKGAKGKNAGKRKATGAKTKGAQAKGKGKGKGKQQENVENADEEANGNDNTADGAPDAAATDPAEGDEEPAAKPSTRASTRNKDKDDKRKANEGKKADPKKAETKMAEPKKATEPKKAAGTKRSAPASSDKPSTSSSNKKQKSASTSNEKNDSKIGSKHDKASPPSGTSAGSNTRLPKKGQQVSWKSLPGWVHGTVVEVVREEKTFQGKTVKGKKDDPRIVLEAQSGKIAGHKPDACYF